MQKLAITNTSSSVSSGTFMCIGQINVKRANKNMQVLLILKN